jgi:hypothetical protein
MNEGRTRQIREQIHRDSARFAEARVYTLNNPYLTSAEKTEVELWFQLPIHFALLTFLFCAVFSVYRPLNWLSLIGIPLAVDFVSGALLWLFYRRKVILGVYAVLTHNWILWFATLSAAIWLLISGHYLLASATILAKLIFGALLGLPHMLLYSALSRRYRMAAKYAFFKRFYGHTFPFETEI